MAEMQKTLITKEGLEKMQKELEDLRTTKRAEVAQRLKEALRSSSKAKRTALTLVLPLPSKIWKNT